MTGEKKEDQQSSFRPPVPRLRDSRLGCLIQAIGLAVASVIGFLTFNLFFAFRESVCCHGLEWPTLIVGGGVSLALFVAIGYWIRR